MKPVNRSPVEPFCDVSWRRRRPPIFGAGSRSARLRRSWRRYAGVSPGGTGDDGVMIGVSVIGVRGLR